MVTPLDFVHSCKTLSFTLAVKGLINFGVNEPYSAIMTDHTTPMNQVPPRFAPC